MDAAVDYEMWWSSLFFGASQAAFVVALVPIISFLTLVPIVHMLLGTLVMMVEAFLNIRDTDTSPRKIQNHVVSSMKLLRDEELGIFPVLHFGIAVVTFVVGCVLYLAGY